LGVIDYENQEADTFNKVALS